MKDVIALALFTTALDRMVKKMKKEGFDATELDGVFAAIAAKHFPQKMLPLGPKG